MPDPSAIQQFQQQAQQTAQTQAPPDPNVQMGGPAPNMPAPAQPQVQQAPSNPNLVHDTMIGRAFKALTGNDTQYSIDPQTGQTVATQSPQRPGQLWRNIVAAAIVGGAAGANGNPQQGFTGGLVRGGAAGVNQGVQQDAQKRQQAQQQFQNQNVAAANQRAQNADQREGQAAATIETLRKAQIAGANIENLRTALLTQGESFKQHQEVAAAGQQHFSDYKTAGLQPVFKDIPETEMQQTIAGRPGSSTFDWEATGVKVAIDPKTGQATHEYLYTAYDPKGQIPVSAGTLAQWKSDGMDKTYPDLFNFVKPGKMLDAQQYIELKRLDTQLFNNNLERTKANQDTEEGKARVKLQNAEAAKDMADAVEAHARAGALSLGKTQASQLGSALTELNTVGGDFSKLKPSSKVIIGESAKTMIPGLTQEIKDAIDSGDQTHANSLMTELDSIRHLSTQVMLGSQVQTPANLVSITMSDGTSGKIPSDKVQDFIAKHPGSSVAGAPRPANNMTQIIRPGMGVLGDPSNMMQ